VLGLTRLELRARKTLRVGPVFEGFVSAGLRHIVVEGDSVSLGSDGELVKEPPLGPRGHARREFRGKCDL
jgi:hypothetical protein